jgi:hypothetical protein
MLLHILSGAHRPKDVQLELLVRTVKQQLGTTVPAER